jgi:hypothetical protein
VKGLWSGVTDIKSTVDLSISSNGAAKAIIDGVTWLGFQQGKVVAIKNGSTVARLDFDTAEIAKVGNVGF